MLKSSMRLASSSAPVAYLGNACASSPSLSHAPLRLCAGERAPAISTRFGESVDVRNRGALRLARLVGIQVPELAAPAIVRLWSGETCRELTSGEARALAAQLIDAADHADAQNGG